MIAATAGAALAAYAPRAVPVGTVQNEFALDLYRHLVAAKSGDNLFISPYSIYAALAMTAEGARSKTAEEMGRALHLAAALRRQGGEAATRPWDFAPVHARLGELAAALQRGTGEGSGLSARVDSLHTALTGANAAAKQARDHGDSKGAIKHQQVAMQLADELNALLPEVDRYQLRIANALWADAGCAISPAFVAMLATHYGTGGVQGVDFRHDAEGARGRINSWAAEQTEQRIRDLLPAGSVNQLTRLVLANAIWFKGEWGEVFDSTQTRDESFRLAAGKSARVPLMHRELRSARYAAFRGDGSLFPTPREIDVAAREDPTGPQFYPGSGGFQIAELPYKGGGLSMVILLPHAPDGLATLERQLDAARLSAWIGALERRSTDVFLPRFRLEQGRELQAPLEAMGMKRAFVDGSAEFGGMTTSTNPADALSVSAVLHQAFLEVNEKGTEAAAATAVVMTRSARPVQAVPFVPTFRADRPFLFLIRDGSSGAILFMGRFVRP